jgi:hypothetical protein
MQTWIEIITDPNHLFADFLMNIVFELTFAWLTYRGILKLLKKRYDIKDGKN